MLKRPTAGLEAKDVDFGMKAFDSFVRGNELDEDEKKALSLSGSGSTTDTSAYAPADYVAELIKTITEISPVRSVARIRQTSNKEIEIPSRTATFAAQWTAEVATRAETTGYTTSIRFSA